MLCEVVTHLGTIELVTCPRYYAASVALEEAVYLLGGTTSGQGNISRVL